VKKVRFSVDGAVVEVEIDDPGEAERVAALFPTYVLGRKGPTAQAVISVRTDADGGTVRFGDSIERYESRNDRLAAIEFEVNRRLLATQAKYVHLHASGAVVDGGAVVAVGPSGSGKSNMAMAWHRAGYRLLGDDAILLGNDGRVRGFARLLKLDDDRAGAFGIEIERTLAFDATYGEIWYDPCDGAGWATDSVPLRTVAWVGWTPGASLTVRRLEPAESLNRLFGDLFKTGLEPAEAVPALALVASQAELLEVEFDDAVEAAAVLAHVASASRDESA
jgi:hypothetical protein